MSRTAVVLGALAAKKGEASTPPTAAAEETVAA